MIGGGVVKQLYDLHGQGVSLRGIGRSLGLSRNTVRKYVRSPEVPKEKPRSKRPSKLDPYKPYVRERMAAGVDNAEVLLRDIRSQGYLGGSSILREFVQPLRPPRQPKATVRFETEPGEQAQVDFGRVIFAGVDGKIHHRWVFVLVLSWSRAIYVEFIRHANVENFLRCHVHAFETLGGVPDRCLYDNAKVVVLGRDAGDRPVWNTRFLDFSRRLGFNAQLCRPYRAQTKGKVESGVKYVKGNFWLGAKFVDDEDINRQAKEWAATVANTRVHGTTAERPADRLLAEQPLLAALPDRGTLTPFLRHDRKVGRDGFVQWQRGSYGVPWHWSGKQVQIEAGQETVEIWAGDVRLAVHPRAIRPGQRFILPGQWEGLPTSDRRPGRQPLATQVPWIEVEHRSLAAYEVVS
jgi:transposase